MNDRHLSKESTVYHYRLLQRIHYQAVWQFGYWILPLLLLAWGLLTLNPWPLAIAMLLIPLLHTIIMQISLRTVEKHSLKHWGWSFQIPWLGYRPTSYVSLEKLFRLHLQVLLVSLVLIGCLFPWLSANLLSHFLMVHLWLILPRFLIFVKFRKHYQSGYIKINEKDTSCYSQ